MKAKDLEIGYELGPVTKMAVMRFGGGTLGPASWDPNKWKSDVHEHGWAREHGYKGGLAEGPPALDHIILMMIDLAGKAWYGSGKITMKFINPMYHGDMLTLGGKLEHGDAQAAHVGNGDDGIAMRHVDCKHSA